MIMLLPGRFVGPPALAAAALASTCVVAITCGESSSGPASPDAGALDPSALASIDRFEPGSSRVGQTVQLQVLGQDFLAQDEIVLERAGLVLEEVKTAETRFLSERELLAVVRIDFRAPIGPYGVTVRRGGRKRGAALEDFVVLPPAETPTAPVDTTPDSPPLSLGTVAGKIAFVRNEFRSLEPPWQLGDIHIFQAGLVWNVSRHPADDRDPSLSPNGQRVAFTSNRSGDYELYVMNVDGGGVTRLTNRRGVDHQPVWSPDGKKIAFTHDPQNTIVPENRWHREFSGDYDIWIIDVDGSNLTRLTSSPLLEGALGLDWSPDGERIVFSAISPDTGFPEGDLHVVPVKGGVPTQLTQGPYLEHAPSWSNDGSILYSKPEYTLRTYIDGIPKQILPYTEVRTHAVYRVREGEGSELVAGGFDSPRYWPSSSPDGEYMVLTRIVKANPPIHLSAEDLAFYNHFMTWSTGRIEQRPRSTAVLHQPVFSILDSSGRTLDLPQATGVIIQEVRGDTMVFVDGYPSTYDSDPDWGP